MYSLIYFFAGAHKNGSHFQFYVLEEALRQRSSAYRVEGADIFHERDLSRARKLFWELRGTDDLILCKGHWHRRQEQKLLLGEKNLKIFLIWRDLKDVLISSYHYKINKFRANYKDFSEFYFNDGGRDLLIHQRLYRMSLVGEVLSMRRAMKRWSRTFQREAALLLSYAGVGDVDLATLEAEIRNRSTARDTR